jgi:transposase
MPRPKKLTAEQHKILAERHLLHMRLRLEAAKHSEYALAREFGVAESTVRAYLNRKVA